ncbi:hypothetical protein JOF42_002447 [Microbacterium phyllosphaerae]|uniref:Uncharacterized protein n=1 Tax=Microbacterium phyllosphaerae TaxID=124798 RepID=A0ABS4WRW5_9MICO|nr:hypothetical protein [Microbacterium phyllosphaerae]MBP2378952.1 hypothetical protein [Microbacterium phyllosphaerae]
MTVVISVQHATETSTSSWYQDPAIGRELRFLAERGVQIKTAAEYFDGQPGPHGERFLSLEFPVDIDLTVWFDDTRNMWRLEVNTCDVRPCDTAAQVAQAANIAEAARVCRDFNNRIIRQTRRDGNALITTEINALLADREVDVFDLGRAMDLTPGALASKLAGRTGWTGADLLRVANVIDPDDPAEIFQRLAKLMSRGA